MALKQEALSSQSISADTNSSSISCKYVDLLSVQVDISSASSPSATVKLQASNDNSNWVDIDGSSVSITADGTEIISVSDFSHRWVRAAFTVSSGSFTAQVLVSGKERM